MAYIASKFAKNEDEVQAGDTDWVTVAETDTITVVQGANNKVGIVAGWIGVTAAVTTGALRLVLHTESTGDQILGTEIAIATLTSFSACDAAESGGLVSGPSGAAHKAKLQVRAGSGISTATVPAGRGWIRMTYANT